MPIDEVRLKDIDWNDLVVGQGRGDDVPALLRSLWSPSREARTAAYTRLDDVLHHQLSRYEVSAVAVPFLIDVIADPQAPDRHLACLLLSGLAIGDESNWLADAPNVDDRRREALRKAGLSVAELEQGLADWVAAAPTEALRQLREEAAEYDDPVETRRYEEWELAAYEAVRAGIPTYVAALGSDDPALRLCSAYLLGWFAEDRAIIAPPLARLLAEETTSTVLVTAAIAAGLLGPPAPDLVPVLNMRLGSEYAAERWATAIALARLAPDPDPRVGAELIDCLRHGDQIPPVVRYADGDITVLAAISLARMPRGAVPDRIAVLRQRMAHVSPGPTALLLAEAMFTAAFPDGPLPDGASFADLTDDQRAVAVDLLAGHDTSRTFWLSDLARQFNLPPAIGLPDDS